MELEDYIEKYLNNTASEAEKQLVDAWFEKVQNTESYPSYNRNAIEYAMWVQIEAAMNREKTTRPARIFSFGRLSRVAVLVGVVALLGIGYYQWSKHAATTMAYNNGHRVSRKAATNGGFIAMQQDKMVKIEDLAGDAATVIGNLSFRKSGDGIVINSVGNHFSDTSAIAIITPKGKFLQLTLPDNTVVKLNVASELRLAQNYLQQRTLQLSGEAFFNVVHNEQLPFRVHVGNAIVEDIGTRFNIQAYEGQATQVVTTVIEGAAKVISLNNAHTQVIDTKTITANQQAIVLPKPTSVAILNNADEIKSAVAWEQGYFLFYNSDIKDILRSVGDWYNVKFDIGANVKGAFSGGLSRAANLNAMLEVLETSGNCQFEIISPNEIKVTSTESKSR
ncbi:FecR family protein [Filimonas lacunae]|uniref:FecR family protein n=2 Tax=Filimonas lacunae TaxID=477680 RepID=A0A1N7RG94_9BACT|nr:FecR family protein [Filimonas lacunae]